VLKGWRVLVDLESVDEGGDGGFVDVSVREASEFEKEVRVLRESKQSLARS
jgi:hypothetical protein